MSEELDCVSFVVTKGSEADERLQAFHKQMQKNRRTLNKLIKRLKLPKTDRSVLQAGGAVRGLYVGDELPELWSRCKGWKNYAYPMRRKANRDLIKEIEAIKLPCVRGIAQAVFGTTTLCFTDGLKVLEGVGLIQVGDRSVIQFANQEHVDSYKKDEKATWPRGLRSVKESTVLKWQEEAKAAEKPKPKSKPKKKLSEQDVLRKALRKVKREGKITVVQALSGLTMQRLNEFLKGSDLSLVEKSQLTPFVPVDEVKA